MAGGQQHGQLVQARGSGRARPGRPLGRAVPIDRRIHQALAGQAQVGVARRRLARQHQVQVVQRQLAQQLLELAVVADQAQVRGGQHRRQQGMGSQLGDAVREAHRQAHHRAAGGLPHLVGNELTDLEDLLGPGEGGLTRLGERHAAPAGLSSWWPSAFSSSRTWALMVCTAMPRRSAARAKPPSLVTTQK
jgi:hypothetical protein